MIPPRLVVLGLFLPFLALPAHAQDGENVLPEPEIPTHVVEPYQPAWSSPRIAELAESLSGTWRTVDSVESMTGEDGATEPVYLVMSVAPVPVEGMTDTLYVETARTTSAWDPYRRAIFQIYPYKDGLRLRTYELAVGDVSDGVFNGMFAAPEYFPDLSSDDLIATLDLDLQPTDTGFTGSTPYPYPTGVGGAVEMTSEISLDADTLTVADRGYNAQGEVVWGADEDSSYLFEQSQGIVTTDRRPDGMFILDYGGASGPIVANGDTMKVHYEGFLESKHRFDSSYDRGSPFTFPYPPGGRAITGWGIGMENLAEGARRKLIIPGHLGYGPNGNPRAGIPGDATLYFNVHLVGLDRPPVQPVNPEQPPAEQPAEVPED